ncbi:hypothetical protein BCR33DRAFT_531520 [Rhizoclosmatium globosum]|uniref:Uncharacterized protein n=1 Tax=Rhizoclosmatium globosum TaxID=329046 RepID=A0A1Y2CUG2_9FUNG|nr:hypothetical protein BCR33DRAFT_531520 [Rhizoclosmatium globosum]|eukprot:ORY50526.1 hypothetical protein BCR33DRAFT_531520 [Rhizoclosmatium globosum]
MKKSVQSVLETPSKHNKTTAGPRTPSTAASTPSLRVKETPRTVLHFQLPHLNKQTEKVD